MENTLETNEDLVKEKVEEVNKTKKITTTSLLLIICFALVLINFGYTYYVYSSGLSALTKTNTELQTAKNKIG